MSPTPSIRARLFRAHAGFSLDVDLTLPGRGVTALFGHSGSGKTTCLRLVAGIERAPGSLVEVNGETWQDDSRGVFVPVHRRALGYVFQDAALFPHLTVSQNLEYGRKRRPSALSVDFKSLVDLLGIAPLLGRRPPTLSGGERQRVAIARALLADPRLLLMDEPLAALDLARKCEILPYLEKLHDTLEIPVLYVTHSPDEVARLADHLVVLSAGRVVASGPVASTLARLDLPGALNDDASSVIEGAVTACDESYRLVSLAFPGGVLRIVHPSVPVGSHLRARILARDVSLALAPPAGNSILNIIPAVVVEESADADTGHVLVRLDAGGAPLLARISRLSRDQLGLRPGLAVLAQIKAVSVLS